MPEPRVQQVQHRVLGAADVQIDRHPALLLRRVPGPLRVPRVEVAKVVPATARPLRHRIRLAFGPGPVRQRHVEPVGGLRQRRFARSRRPVILDLRQPQRQLIFRQTDHPAILRMQNRKRLPPIALPAEEPVAQLVVNRLPALPVLGQPGRYPLLELRRGQTVEWAAVNRLAIADETTLALPDPLRILRIRRLHHRDNRQAELPGEFEVPLVMGRHRHDCPGAVADQDVVAYPDGDFLVVDGIDGVRPREDTRLLLGQVGPVQVALAGGGLAILPDRPLLLGGCNYLDEGMLGGHDHVRRSEERIRPGREDPDIGVMRVDRKTDLCSDALADPIDLQLLDGFGPIHLVQVIEQPFGILRDT